MSRLLILLLLALGACAPTYQSQYQFITPATPQIRACTAQCTGEGATKAACYTRCGGRVIEQKNCVAGCADDHIAPVATPTVIEG